MANLATEITPDAKQALEGFRYIGIVHYAAVGGLVRVYEVRSPNDLWRPFFDSLIKR